MSYRCGFCHKSTPANQPMRKRLYYKVNQQGHRQIEREVPVCGSCDSALDNGVSPGVLGQEPARTRQGKQKAKRPACDVCGADASNGQVTAESTLCPVHLKPLSKGAGPRRTK